MHTPDLLPGARGNIEHGYRQRHSIGIGAQCVIYAMKAI